MYIYLNKVYTITPILFYYVCKFHMTETIYYIPPENFPVLSLGILASGLLTSAISMSNLFPYVGFMVIDLGLAENEDDAGNYAGYVASSLMLGRFFSSFYWGQKADIIGRKPVICFGIGAIITFSLLFGFSTNIWMALISRFLLGLLVTFYFKLVNQIIHDKN